MRHRSKQVFGFFHGLDFNLCVNVVHGIRNKHISVNLVFFGLNVHGNFRTFGETIFKRFLDNIPRFLGNNDSIGLILDRTHRLFRKGLVLFKFFGTYVIGIVKQFPQAGHKSGIIAIKGLAPDSHVGKFHVACGSLGFIIGKFKAGELPVFYLAVFSFYALAFGLVVRTGKITKMLGLLFRNNHSYTPMFPKIWNGPVRFLNLSLALSK